MEEQHHSERKRATSTDTEVDHEEIGDIVEGVGFGRGQIPVMLASILGWLGDGKIFFLIFFAHLGHLTDVISQLLLGMQPLLLSFVLPAVAMEWPDMSPGVNGLIGSSLFVGMLAGSFLFGTVADRIGRRATLFITSIQPFSS